MTCSSQPLERAPRRASASRWADPLEVAQVDHRVLIKALEVEFFSLDQQLARRARAVTRTHLVFEWRADQVDQAADDVAGVAVRNLSAARLLTSLDGLKHG